MILSPPQLSRRQFAGLVRGMQVGALGDPSQIAAAAIVRQLNANVAQLDADINSVDSLSFATGQGLAFITLWKGFVVAWSVWVQVPNHMQGMALTGGGDVFTDAAFNAQFNSKVDDYNAALDQFTTPLAQGGLGFHSLSLPQQRAEMAFNPAPSPGTVVPAPGGMTSNEKLLLVGGIIVAVLGVFAYTNRDLEVSRGGTKVRYHSETRRRRR